MSAHPQFLDTAPIDAEPYIQWDEQESMSFSMHPLTWGDELWQIAVFCVIAAWFAVLGWSLILIFESGKL
jgi:hypothetical protein